MRGFGKDWFLSLRDGASEANTNFVTKWKERRRNGSVGTTGY